MSLIAGAGEKVTFFEDDALDASLAAVNEAFWVSLLGHIEAELAAAPDVVLDVGSHAGGLLDLIADRLRPREVIGIEPVARLREAAAVRLRMKGANCRVLGSDEWDQVSDGSIDLLVCHEVLYLIRDLPALMREFRRVLGRGGSAFVVLGCHSDNPIWPSWKHRLVAQGIGAYDHSPFQIMTAAWGAGLATDVQPLRRAGWISYDPENAPFPFPDAGTMFDHHYRHKLLFRMKLDDDGNPPAA